MSSVGGIDIGGTNTRWIIRKNGRIVFRDMAKTPRGRHEFSALLKKICSGFETRGVVHVGIGAPGTVRGTTLRYAPNIPAVRNFDFKKVLPRGMEVRVDNDARCFARAEVQRQKVRRLLCVTIGTGLGRALALDGRVTLIHRFELPESWEAEYQKLARKKSPSLPAFIARNIARLALSKAAGLVMIGGGRLDQKGFYARLSRELRKAGVQNVRRSRLGKNAGVIGAALLWNSNV